MLLTPEPLIPGINSCIEGVSGKPAFVPPPPQQAITPSPSGVVGVVQSSNLQQQPATAADKADDLADHHANAAAILAAAGNLADAAAATNRHEALQQKRSLGISAVAAPLETRSIVDAAIEQAMASTKVSCLYDVDAQCIATTPPYRVDLLLQSKHNIVCHCTSHIESGIYRRCGIEVIVQH